MANIELRNVDKVFPGRIRAVDNLSLVVEEGEFLVIVGPSGCGKSTVLRLLAGLESVTAGQILIDGHVVNQQSPGERNIAMIFQSYALYPHKTVRKNLEFPLRMMKLTRVEIDRRVRETAHLLGLQTLLDRKPGELSGGQSQRVAMGRALVRDPRVFLMDEPLSNLDARLRVHIREEIRDLQQRLGITTIYVTHDQAEAMTLGKRVAVLNKGKLQQVGPARELYDNPDNLFVATFLGNPVMNIFRTVLRKSETGGWSADFGGTRLSVHPERMRDKRHLASYLDQPVLAGLRPEDFSLSDREPGAVRQIDVKVDAVDSLGHEHIIHFKPPVEMVLNQGAGVPEGQKKRKRDSGMTLRLTSGPIPERGETITLCVDSSRMHLFSIQGQAI